MCLERITNENPVKTGIGYKVFKYRKICDYGSLIEEYLEAPCWPDNGDKFNLCTFYRDKNYFSILTNDDSCYGTGYHIFKNKEDACLYSCGEARLHIYKVYYDDAVVEGRQEVWKRAINDFYYADCVVAKQITLLERVA